MANQADTARRPDLRVRRTRSRLGRAMVELTLERGYDAVTIRDLTERADIGYATFFRHYPDKEALLRDLLEEVLDGLMERLEPVSADDDAERTGTLVFRHARAHASLYRVLLASQRSVDLLGRALEVGEASIYRSFAARPGSVVPLEVAAQHIIRSFMALIEWWLRHDMPYPPETMGRIYRDLIMDPTRAAALEPLPD
ncbi:MAG: TetR/AcrR family transcriptional regulator [Deinococcales bacterium]